MTLRFSMKMLFCTLAVLAAVQPFLARATAAEGGSEGQKTLYSAAVLDFSSKDRANPEEGKEVAMLLTAFLSENTELTMVERQQLETVINEAALGLSGTITSETAVKIGQLVGAKIMITGSVMALGKEKTLVAKVMGTETGRVFAIPEKVGRSDSMSDACLALAEKINAKIVENSSALIAAPESPTDFVDKKKEQLQGKKLPSVTISIPEMHVGQTAPDPAVQTEAALILQQLGFTVLEENATEKPAIRLEGEAFSERGISRGELISCTARVEIKAIEVATGKVLAVDRQTETVPNMSEQAAGKAALEKAAAKLMERIVDKMVL